jgi:hypothetical protein
VVFNVFANKAKCNLTDRDNALNPALAHDLDKALFEVNAANAQVHQLTHTQATGVHEFKHSPVTHIADLVKQPANQLLGHDRANILVASLSKPYGTKGILSNHTLALQELIKLLVQIETAICSLGTVNSKARLEPVQTVNTAKALKRLPTRLNIDREFVQVVSVLSHRASSQTALELERLDVVVNETDLFHKSSCALNEKKCGKVNHKDNNKYYLNEYVDMGVNNA